MSVQPFEDFVVEQLLSWLVKEGQTDRVKPGVRFQFKSADQANSEKLFAALMSHAHSEPIVYGGFKLPFIEINDVRLIPLLHGGTGSGFTENYISHLRDEATKKTGKLANCAILIVHNSLLDTIINSAFDLAQEKAPWNTEQFKEALQPLIIHHEDSQEVSDVLLDYQFDAIEEAGATLFGFESLYHAIQDGDIQFGELGLIKDPLIHLFKKHPKQLRNRLDENRKLYNELSNAVEYFPDDLDSRLAGKFGSKFISKNFPKANIEAWKLQTFDHYQTEIKHNKKPTIEFEKFDKKKCIINFRTKGTNKAGQRQLHLIIEVPPALDEFDFDIIWRGELHNSELSQPNKLLPAGNIFSVRKNNPNKLQVKSTMGDEPLFFTIGTGGRDKGSDKYTFHCLVIRQGSFNVDAIKRIFLIRPKHKQITLLTEENQLHLNPAAHSIVELKSADETLAWESTKMVDFRHLSEISNDVTFFVGYRNSILKFIIEGEDSDIPLTLPLLFDQDRFDSLLVDDYFGEFNRDKNKVFIDNKEVSLVGKRLSYCKLEAQFIDEQLLFIDMNDQQSISLPQLQSIDTNLYVAYQALFNYLTERKTLPSLVSWGADFRQIVGAVVDAYIIYLERTPLKKRLSQDVRDVLKIGFVVKGEIEFLSPFHPLVLSYYLALAT
ncbi:MAG: DNA phosphorothioation-dependent restriction protein DptH, partial [Phenylobacterium sp.]